VGSPSKARNAQVWASPTVIVLGEAGKFGTVSINQIPTVLTSVFPERFGAVLIGAGGVVGAVGQSGGPVSPLRSFVYLTGSVDSVEVSGSIDDEVDLTGGITLTEVNQNFEMYSGDSKSIYVTVAGEDLSGSAIKFQAARSVQDSAVITKTTGDGIQITGAGNSVISISLDAEDTEALVGKYYFEVQVTSAAGKVSTVAVGRMKIMQDLIQ
jgi:hypothetical protein